MILDGDIDPEWIEAMNTVMDDNKVLTLASNERIPMTTSMRMLLEIEDMRNATPATASRGGCLCINEPDVGYLPYLNQWKDTLKDRIIKKIDPDNALGGKFKTDSENDLLQVIKTQIELCYDSGWFKDTMMVMYLDEIEPAVPIRRMAICQCITAILDAYFFDDKERKNFIELKGADEEKCKNAIAMLFY